MNYNYKYILYELAQNDILEITTYFINQLNNKKVANYLIEAFIEKIKIACNEPYLYKLDPSPKLAKKGIRRIPCES